MKIDKQRKLFEKRFDRPEGVHYNSVTNKYETYYDYLEAYSYQIQWETWQAALGLKEILALREDAERYRYLRSVAVNEVMEKQK